MEIGILYVSAPAACAMWKRQTLGKTTAHRPLLPGVEPKRLSSKYVHIGTDMHAKVRLCGVASLGEGKIMKTSGMCRQPPRLPKSTTIMTCRDTERRKSTTATNGRSTAIFLYMCARCPPPSLGNPGNTRNMQVAGPFGCTTSRRYETMWRRTLVGRECRTMPGKATAGYSTTSCEGQPDPRPHTANTLAIFEAVTHLVPRRHLPTPPGQGSECCLGEPGARAQQALMPACTNVL